MAKGFESFEFDLPGALLERLIQVLDGMKAESLTAEHVQEIPEAQGVYQLFLDGDLVYIGKTDAEAGLRKRLHRHAGKILNRPALEKRTVTFKAVRIYVFTAMDLETALINHYKSRGSPSVWNGSGFGSNDPGRERETTNSRPEGFDAQFPISVDTQQAFLPVGPHNVAAALATLKSSLTYTLRYQAEKPRARKPHPDLSATTFEVTNSPQTVRELLTAMLAALPDGWQATIFNSHVILYKEDRSYTYGVELRKPVAETPNGIPTG